MIEIIKIVRMCEKVSTKLTLIFIKQHNFVIFTKLCFFRVSQAIIEREQELKEAILIITLTDFTISFMKLLLFLEDIHQGNPQADESKISKTG